VAPARGEQVKVAVVKPHTVRGDKAWTQHAKLGKMSQRGLSIKRALHDRLQARFRDVHMDRQAVALGQLDACEHEFIGAMMRNGRRIANEIPAGNAVLAFEIEATAATISPPDASAAVLIFCRSASGSASGQSGIA